MDIHAKLDELHTFADLIKDRVDVLKKEISNQGKSKKPVENKSLRLLAEARAKRAKYRIS
ncbi:hypothetical protein [Aequorivita lipolytica]|uniref:Uncharacterized protein n=2 Tax=Aequorivita lipolytica TaxID=153267 RepID=A0A5C6YLM9_9FLAO|nr:hypothetical protein [Aequorivita lipolytica]TXD67910.1 hypothetical protein ESV24_14545 [Aequorivita lipolytica]SRX53781.1 hypothetical protein AEQU2_02974 [Aequorivita lipolytica]